MDEKTIIKTENGHDVKIALIQKDIEYIRDGIKNLSNEMTTMDKNFARRDELAAMVKALDAITSSVNQKADHKETTDALSLKVDKKEFEPMQKTLYRINWILISSVIVGLLALLYKAG